MSLRTPRRFRRASATGTALVAALGPVVVGALIARSVGGDPMVSVNALIAGGGQRARLSRDQLRSCRSRLTGRRTRTTRRASATPRTRTARRILGVRRTRTARRTPTVRGPGTVDGLRTVRGLRAGTRYGNGASGAAPGTPGAPASPGATGAGSPGRRTFRPGRARR
ncbi:hypothetical protein [Streptomyces filamentosus]|uniref:hypothetical protein n=1 Tax=Streptomyces filamentosus TaxID=67294 RepID=UPI001BAE18DB|nr:hypothetical protein [Streptomyces filamentosus]